MSEWHLDEELAKRVSDHDFMNQPLDPEVEYEERLAWIEDQKIIDAFENQAQDEEESPAVTPLPTTPTKKTQFRKMYVGNPTYPMLTLRKKHKQQQTLSDKRSGTVSYSIERLPNSKEKISPTNKQILVVIPGIFDLTFNVTIEKTLRRVLSEFTENCRPIANKLKNSLLSDEEIQKLCDSFRTMELDLSDLMEVTNSVSEESGKKLIKQAIDVLSKTKIHYYEIEKKGREYIEVPNVYPLLGKVRGNYKYLTIGGKIKLAINYDITPRIVRGYIIHCSPKLDNIDPKKHPFAWYVGLALERYYNLIVTKGNPNRIGTETLLDILDMDKREDISIHKTDRHVTRYTIERIENNLIILRDIYGFLVYWKYVKKNGEPVPPEELKRKHYSDWITWLIEYEIAGYPYQQPQNEAIEIISQTPIATEVVE